MEAITASILGNTTITVLIITTWYLFFRTHEIFFFDLNEAQHEALYDVLTKNGLYEYEPKGNCVLIKLGMWKRISVRLPYSGNLKTVEKGEVATLGVTNRSFSGFIYDGLHVVFNDQAGDALIWKFVLTVVIVCAEQYSADNLHFLGPHAIAIELMKHCYFTDINAYFGRLKESDGSDFTHEDCIEIAISEVVSCRRIEATSKNIEANSKNIEANSKNIKKVGIQVHLLQERTFNFEQNLDQHGVAIDKLNWLYKSLERQFDQSKKEKLKSSTISQLKAKAKREFGCTEADFKGLKLKQHYIDFVWDLMQTKKMQNVSE